ncbi:DUF4422 domain-containing protein [Lactococcus lactis]|uniref:DUF4422 domain-containing protein n=1 Tax=Lactococcus lactis TaxID=1358 RepID=UPI003D0E4566
MKIRILEIGHKEFKLPRKEGYSRIFVGPEKDELAKEGDFRDDNGQNISQMNPYYCELTAIYWAWKNLDEDVLGFAHYRRHFMSSKNQWSFVKISEVSKIILENAIILPKAHQLFDRTVLEDYGAHHNVGDMKKIRKIIEEKYPQYTYAFDIVMSRNYYHPYNMFIMHHKELDEYCNFLFDVLKSSEDKINYLDYNAFDARVFGFISERLLDVWIYAEKKEYYELPVHMFEKSFSKILLYAGNFVKRRIGKKGDKI